MSEIWSADLSVPQELAAGLIREQFAPLPRRSVVLLSEGWDYAVFRVDDDWTFRFPRRDVVVPGTELEVAVLPLLAPLLPVPVPAPSFLGRPVDRFPRPFYGAAFLRGAEPGVSLSGRARAGIARPLARALRALHAPEALAAAGSLLPADPMLRADMAVRVPRTREALAALGELGGWRASPAAEAILDRALELGPAQPTAVCHGDLHFRQLLVDGRELTGIVDWVDVCRSDPGVDLAIAWSLLPPPARAEFLDEYGPVSAGSLLRGRVVALYLSAALARYAHIESLAGVEAEALAALDRTLEG